jgi:hypothetical protein
MVAPVKKVLAMTTLATVLVLSACASPTTTAEAPSPTAEATARATTSPSPTRSPTPPADRTVGWECSFEQKAVNNIGPSTWTEVTYRNLAERWTAQDPSFCEVVVITPGPYSTAERNAVAAAGYDSISKVEYLWDICGATDRHYQTTGPINDAQRTESNAALLLCPEHPAAATMANGSVEQQERDAGLRFGAGVREVGTQLQPGTYRATGDIENCYWERLDAAGGTIDNDFVLAATQVEVTVEASDFSLSTRGCGEFVKVG